MAGLLLVSTSHALVAIAAFWLGRKVGYLDGRIEMKNRIHSAASAVTSKDPELSSFLVGIACRVSPSILASRWRSGKPVVLVEDLRDV